MSTNHKPTLRVLSVIEAIALKKDGYKLSELSKLLNIPIGTLSPIIHTLKEKKYLSYNQLSQQYCTGIKLLEIGSSYIKNSNRYDDVIEVIETIVDECGETCHFGVLDEGDILYIAKVDSDQAVRLHSAIGKTIPAYGTAIGKALLKDYSMEELQELYPAGLKPLTPYTITDFDILYNQLQNIKESGFAYECEESNESIRCIAKSIYKNGKVAAALSVAVPIFRYSEEKRKLIEQVLTEGAKTIEKLILYLTI
ncbi:IclR family transcriptional regulator [Clostridium oceanicum]|uniref:IclR family transcriptional regulator n=1 Tax=Clostridium oceanicum TaxID=1543 RepID=A0ABP3UGV4_9CLOT